MRLSLILPLVAALSLTACNKAGTGSGAAGTTPEKAAAAIAGVHFRPGLYQTKIDLKAKWPTRRRSTA